MPQWNEDGTLLLVPVGSATEVPSGPHDKETGGPGGGNADLHPPASEKADAFDFAKAQATLKQARRRLLAAHATNCSGFVKEYAKLYAMLFNVPAAVLPESRANKLVGHMRSHFKHVDGKTAKAHADQGQICFAALEGEWVVNPKTNKKEQEDGHVMIVVPGPGRVIDGKTYPNVLGGGSNPRGRSDGSKTSGDTWSVTRRKDVEYFILKPKPAPAPRPEPPPEEPPEM